ncbi:MAG TPA: hypothetical protein VF525_04845 [Pyrinomonadaceae bacterium]|jgi:sugar lactone lactonase YvrE
MRQRLRLNVYQRLRLSAYAFIVVLVVVCAVQAHPAWGIVVDDSGRVIFSDLETVWRLDAEGRVSSVRAGEFGRHVHDLALDAAGNLYGIDHSYDAPKWIDGLWRITPAGEFSYLFPPTADAPAWLSLRRDRAGNTYFVRQGADAGDDVLLLRRSPTGQISTLAGGRAGFADGRGAQARFRHIGSMTLAADDALYLLDAGALRRVAPDGTVKTIARDLDKFRPEERPAGGQMPGGFMGLCVDAGGNTYIADHTNRRVLRVGRDGQTTTLLRTDAIWLPTGVAAGPHGEIYMLEIGFTPPRYYSGPRVRRVAPDGQSTVLAEIGPPNRSGGERTTPLRVADTQPAARPTHTAALTDEHAARGRAVKLSLVFLCLVLLAVSFAGWRRR